MIIVQFPTIRHTIPSSFQYHIRSFSYITPAGTAIPSYNRPALKSLKWRRTVRKTGHWGQFSTSSYIISGFTMQDALAQADQQKLLPANHHPPILMRLCFPKRHKNYSTANDKRTKTARLSRFSYFPNNQLLILKCSTLGKRSCVCITFLMKF